jgi:hypothetical protein
MRSRTRRIFWLLGSAALAACNDDNAPPPLAAVVPVSNVAISGTVDDLIDAVTVKVTDSNGAARGGVPVTFAIAEGGGSVSKTVDTTDVTGRASTSWRLGQQVVSQRLTATVAGVSSPATFVASVRAAAPSTLTVVSGDGQSGVSGSTLATPLSIRLRDRFQNPVPGVTVVFSVNAGGGGIAGASATTNSDGIATSGTWTLGTATGANRATALALASGIANNPAAFSASATSGAVAAMTATTSTVISGVVGGAVSPLPTVRVTDANGNPVQGASVAFVPTGGTLSGNAKATNANGVASPDSWTLGSVAQSYTLTASVTGAPPVAFVVSAAPGAPAQVTIVAGNNQAAPVGRTLDVDPAVRVTDAFANPIAGVEVLFEVTSGGGSAVARRQITDRNGLAVVGAWTMGDAPGTNTLRATVTGTNIAGSPATFTATATPGAPALVVASTGNGQTAVAGSILPTSPSVVVRDTRGNPVSGVSVTFTVVSGGGILTGANATTNSAGVATVGSWRLGNTAGAQSIRATVGTLDPVTFTATATAGSAARVVAEVDANLGSVPVTNFVSTLPTVTVLDANDNPVAGATVTFELDAQPFMSVAPVLTGTTKVTGADGRASLTSFRLGSLAGEYRVRVLVEGLDQGGFEPTFVATGTALSASSVAVSITSLQSQAGVAGAAVTSIPVVRVVDLYGNGVANTSVTFTVGAGTSTVGAGQATVTTTTDELGFASVGSWTMGAGSGARTLVATVAGGGIANNPITFTATVP